MMSWTNYHNHSQYDDGKDTIENHVTAAIDQGVKSMGFSGHCPVSFENNWCMKKESIEDYLNDIADAKGKYKNQIQLYKGLEVDFIPGIISPTDSWIKALKLDYSIGSIHFAGKYPNGLPGEIDSTHTKFLDGLEHIYHGNIKALVKEYYALTRQMVKESKPDIIGHMDKIKIQNHDLWDESSGWYQNEVLATLEEIKSANTIIEVNTRGIYKKLTLETYPSPWILNHIHQMNIPIHINSDAHVPKEIINNFAEATELIISLGFKKVKVVHNGNWDFVNIGQNGLVM